MKLACVLVLAGCAGAAKPASPPAPNGDVAPAPPVQTTTTTSTTTTTTSTASSYSCFNYTSGGTKRYACSRTAECDDYLEQARAVGGLQNLSACAKVEAVYCFHAKTDAEGSDVCQPTLELCASERAALVRAKQPVESDCATR